jgi:hypothetical protein
LFSKAATFKSDHSGLILLVKARMNTENGSSFFTVRSLLELATSEEEETEEETVIFLEKIIK